MNINETAIQQIHKNIAQVEDTKTRLALGELLNFIEIQAHLNEQQERHIKARIQRQEWLEVPVVALFGFLIVTAVGLVSIRVTPEGVTFDAMAALREFFTAPVISTFVTAIATIVIKDMRDRRENRSTEDTEQKMSSETPLREF